ncbi:hypothetical protein IT568_02820 [bacterium]|nr:hypothetical protein [bacterium]
MTNKFLQQLSKLIVQDYEHKLTEQEQELFSLPEKSEAATCKTAKFKKAKEQEILIYKFDENQDKFPFFKDLEKAKSMCDYILFYAKGENKIFVFICNLKSKNTNNNSEQMRAGEIFADFLSKTVKRLGKDKLSKIKIRFKWILFSKITNKGTSKPQGTGKKIKEHFFTCDNTCDIETVF